MKSYGLKRVVEPQNTMPVTAWRLDNGKEINKDELRLQLKVIQVDHDSFQQICSCSNFDDARIRLKVMEIVSKRGKLHNPFTGTGGTLAGVIDEVGAEYDLNQEMEKGDLVYCISSITGIPIHIDHIDSIDYNYEQISCSGYAILPETASVIKAPNSNFLKYVLPVMEEGAFSLYFNLHYGSTGKHRHISILAKDCITAVFYAGMLKASNPEIHDIICLFDQSSFPNYSLNDLQNVLVPLCGQVCLLDMSAPISSFEAIKVMIPEFVPRDLTIVCEDIIGAETLALFMTEENGEIFFTSIKNNYSAAILEAMNMQKLFTVHGPEIPVGKYVVPIIELLDSLSPQLRRINDLYEHKLATKKPYPSKGKSMNLLNSGKTDNLVFHCRTSKALIDEALNVSHYDCNVILEGETGTGKEKIMELIHQNSHRKKNPCVKINCATIQENLVEAEFFGYDSGAFTGANTSGKKGFFELANNGILFLDEINHLSLNMQSKLLRVLQENQFYRVGGTVPVSVNVRLICASNVSLKGLVMKGEFREDLYYRLNICRIEVPPLRERSDDIPYLVEHLMEKYGKQYQVIKEIDTEVLSQLCAYHWPGNVRELENVIHRLIIYSKAAVITADMADLVLNDTVYENTMLDTAEIFSRSDSLDFEQIIEKQEKKLISYALKKEGSTRKAAVYLGLTQATLARKKLKYNL